MEFRQLQDIGIFSYMCYSLVKRHVNGCRCSEAWINRVFDLKTFEPSGENPSVMAVNKANPKVSLFT